MSWPASSALKWRTGQTLSRSTRLQLWIQWNCGTRFTPEEMQRAADLVKQSGRKIAPPPRPEGMRRAIMAGFTSIEHGDLGTEEIFQLMKQRNVAYCPTLAAGEAYAIYAGWKKGAEPDPTLVADKKKKFCCGPAIRRNHLYGR